MGELESKGEFDFVAKMEGLHFKAFYWNPFKPDERPAAYDMLVPPEEVRDSMGMSKWSLAVKMAEAQEKPDRLLVEVRSYEVAVRTGINPFIRNPWLRQGWNANVITELGEELEKTADELDKNANEFISKKEAGMIEAAYVAKFYAESLRKFHKMLTQGN